MSQKWTTSNQTDEDDLGDLWRDNYTSPKRVLKNDDSNF